MRSSSRTASASRLSTTSAAPSPRPYPSARASNPFDYPSADRNLPLLMATKTSGRNMTLTPPASASDVSPLQRSWHARWTATSEDEHAVSSEMLGPRKSSMKDRRFESTVMVAPTAV